MVTEVLTQEMFRCSGNNRSVAAVFQAYPRACPPIVGGKLKEIDMSKEDDNKGIVGRWFTDFWGKTCSLSIVDELASLTCCCSIRCTNRAGVGATSRRS